MAEIDPKTGERVLAKGSSPQIDPETGERLGGSPATGQSFNHVAAKPKSGTAIGPSPTGLVPWLQGAEDDLRLGGHRTAVGKGLGFIEGRGDRGYSGLQSGVSPETAEFVGSPALGTAHAVKGMGEIATGKPIKGFGDMQEGARQAATLPAAFMGGPALEAGAEAIPSAKYAGGVLGEIRGAAENVPVRLNNAWPEIERYQALTKTGGATSKPVTQISTRLQNMIRNPSAGDLNFPEARDFYSNISGQSAEDVSRLNPTMRRQMGGIRSGLNQDLTDAASTIGRGKDYASAIKEYAQAQRLKSILKTSAKIGIPAAVGAGILGKIGSNMIGK